MGRHPLSIPVAGKDLKELASILGGGVQQVRVVLRAIALQQLARGVSAPKIASGIPLTPRPLATSAIDIRRVDWMWPFTKGSVLALPPSLIRARSSGLSPWFVANRPRGGPVGLCGWWSRRRSNENWSLGLAGRPSESCFWTTTLSRGGKKMWCVAELDDEYIDKMEDVLETLERPHDPTEPVVCLDEKPVVLHADVRSASPAVPGQEARQDSEYERRGTANVFCAVEPKAGRHFTVSTPDRSALQFSLVLCDLALQYPQATTIHLVLDNLNTHRLKSLTDTFGAEVGAEIWSRFTVHYTPKHGSWLNPAEIEIGLLARQCLGNRRIPDLPTLRRECRAWNRRVNRERVTINWRFTRRAARRKFNYKRHFSKRSQH